jgi:predicted O-linked N-acetylglucosamine transferase (SPINDLY family)
MTDPLAAARAALMRGDVVAARATAEQICLAQPESTDAWFLLGAAQHRAGVPDAALAAFERAARLTPGAAAVANARATVLGELGRSAEARAVLEAALSHAQSADPQLLVNLAIVLERIGETAAAGARYAEALEAGRAARHPAMVPAALNLGALLLRQGRHVEALALHRELVALAPGLADAHFNLAENLLALGAPEAALAAADAALRADSRHVFARIDRAFALALLDRLHEAQGELERARAIDPIRFASYRNAFDPDGNGSLERLDARLLYLQWHHQRLAECDWSRYDGFVQRCRAMIEDHAGWPGPIADPGVPYRALALPLPGPVQAKLARDVGAGALEAVIAAGIEPFRFASGPATPERLRIGYLSPDFRRHPIAHLTRGLYAAHDRSRVEVVGYSLHPGADEPLTREIEAGCDAFHRIAGETTTALVQRIRDDGIHVLVDLAGHTANARAGVFAARAAPVQVTWLGVPWTTGIPNMDYALVDHGGVPAGTEGWWSERLVFLPGSCYVSSSAVLGPPPARAGLGLPEDAFVFCCFNNAWKIEPAVFGCWLRVLASVPAGVLWILGVSEAQRARLRAAAARGGIDPARIVFAPVADHQAHVTRYLAADLFLDTPVYNGHTTALDALWAGLPVLSCPGEIMPSRVAATLLSVLGVQDALVVPTMEAYVARAVHLASDPALLAELRQEIRAACSTTSLFDPVRHARTLEEVFAAMWQRHEDGLPAASFEA